MEFDEPVGDAAGLDDARQGERVLGLQQGAVEFLGCDVGAGQAEAVEGLAADTVFGPVALVTRTESGPTSVVR
ncbi:hypothetical protein [Streptomyces sp. 2131.1]|uniref:hypothetical protein n=1 Tax=Streptomyces sp. 2131.1 TaxID=1855346 RepID=UPI000B85B8B5|nr:hypothetical protein [Streptomyces sp. 2131.1]